MSRSSRVVDDGSDMRKYVFSDFVFLEDFLSRIRIDIEGAAGTLYADEKFQLLFKFTDQYPFDSPQVIH